MTERHYHLHFSQSKYCIYFSCHLHVTCYKTHIMMPLNMQLPVAPNFLSLNISLSFPFPNTLSLQLFPLSDTVFCNHAKQSINTHIYTSISIVSNSSSERKGVWISHSKDYQIQSAVNFLTIQSALLSTVPKCLSDLCHTLNDTISCGYTVSTGIVLVLFMETGCNATDI